MTEKIMNHLKLFSKKNCKVSKFHQVNLLTFRILLQTLLGYQQQILSYPYQVDHIDLHSNLI